MCVLCIQKHRMVGITSLAPASTAEWSQTLLWQNQEDPSTSMFSPTSDWIFLTFEI